ncbi:MAG: hypothetical protein WD227_13015 [Vicinamibacterales bacterium]
MDPMPSMPELTAFDAVTQLVAASVYLTIGAAGLAQAPRDVRTRVFGALGLAHGIAFSIPAAGWLLDVKDPQALNRVPLGIMLAALSVGALLMFHFSQVFPRRRPWIHAAGIQLPIAYAVMPLAVFLLVRWWPLTRAEITAKFGLAFLLFGFPLLVLLGLVLPVASIVSFLRSLREQPPAHPVQGPVARVDATPRPDARPTIFGILLSQLAGGVLGLLVLGPLTAVAPGSLAVMLVAVTVWLLGLLTPMAFAAGVWKYRVLEIPIEPSAEMQPD